jgi:hypothetical protein
MSDFLDQSRHFLSPNLGPFFFKSDFVNTHAI